MSYDAHCQAVVCEQTTRRALRDKMPIREIARRTGVSRNTIEKYLRVEAVEPRFKTPSRPSKLDPCACRLSAWLLAQTRKSYKERRTVKLMYEDLVLLGDDEAYEPVAAFARAWQADRHRAEQTTTRGTCVPLVSNPVKRCSSTGAKTGPGLEATVLPFAILEQTHDHLRRKRRASPLALILQAALTARFSVDQTFPVF